MKKKKMRSVIPVLFVLLTGHALGQTTMTTFDSPPMYAEGEEALFKYIEDHLEYPKKAKKDGVVYVELTINKAGRITETKVLRSTVKAYENNAVEVFNYMPNWEPAKKGGEPYEEKVIVPVEFKASK